MKNSKKLLVLVLSLVMLIAAFAMCVSAEGDKATVQYPDGTTVQYAVGETIIPPFGATYAGAGNTLYKNAGDGWKFSVDGAPLASLTITEDLIGKTITASGYDKVYFSVAETGGSTIYYTDASTVATDFRTYMQAMSSPAGATVTLYGDITCASLAVQGVNTNLNYYLDLNGHKLTITGSSIALDVRQYSFFLYSSKPGGVLDASAGSCLFRTNNGTIFNVEQWGKFYIGEASENGQEYYDNLTVYCKAINSDMYGTGAYVLGGKYVQTAASTSTYMLVIGRVGNSSQSQVQRIRNCTFVVTKASTSPVEQSAKDARTYDGCTFINASGVLGRIFANTTMNGNPEFKNCNFYNVDPIVAYGGKTLNYTGTTTVAFDGVAAPARPSGQFLAHGIAKTVTVDGKTYAMDGVYVTDTATVYGVNWDGLFTDYWMEGTTPAASLSALNYIVENADGTAYFGSDASYEAQGVVTADMIGTVGYVEVTHNSLAPLAFSYKDVVSGALIGGVTYEECGSTAAGVFEKFYALFSDPQGAYLITMYQDMIVNKGMGFGSYVKYSDASHNRDYYNTCALGNIVWDLNGHTVTIAADVTNLINLAAANSVLSTGALNSNQPAVFGFEGENKDAVFTLKSSAPGGKIVNNSSARLFGIGEGRKVRVSIQGENLTIVSDKHYIFYGIEMNRDVVTLTDPRLTINGGTFISAYSSGLMYFCGNTLVQNATFISTNPSVSQLTVLDTYRNGTATFDNVTFIAANATAPAFYSSSSNNHYATFNDCVYIGCEPTTLARCAKLKGLTYTGVSKADTEANLLLICGGTKPAGAIVAQYVVDINGERYNLIGYGKTADVFTVTYGETTAYYLAGSLLLVPAAEELASPYYKDGYYVSVEGYKSYLANKVVTAEMAGKTADAIANIKYVENALAFAIVKDGEIVGHVLLNAEDLSAELVAALAEANDGAELRFYADIEFASIAFFAPAVTLNLNGHVLTVSEKVSNLAPITVENGTIYNIGFWTSLFHADVTLDNVSIYNFGNYGTRVILNNTANVVINDSKLYNLDIDCDGYRNVVMTGTVFHDDETLDGLIYNNNVEYVTCGGTTFEVTYTRAVTSDASKIVTATFMYKGEVKGETAYYIGSIPGYYVEAIDGYYYSYVTYEALYEDAEFTCLFVADESKLKGQIIVTEALNFIYYLQKQEGIEYIVFNGELLNFDDVAVIEIDGADYYVIPVEFASFADCLRPASLEVGIAFGDEIETVTANVSLLDYAREIFAGNHADEDKALVYALLTYVDSIISYFKYDVENEIPALLKANAEYATDYVAAETEEITSDYIRGALFIVDEQVSLALRVDADFKGEIILSIPGENGVKATFIYKNIVEMDGNCYVVLDNVPFCELADGYDISVKMYGEQVESFNYSIANYANAMTMQNMGYIPGYARALSIFATLAAAYVA